ncbi:SprT family protein [Agrilactobacillus fermenti]|uniref:SprT family protein n=1 Tax=Agrilactobacillus fermenti TaxID=2586909 RepID=UPI003A5C4891
MDNQALTKLVQNISQEKFQRPFKHQAIFNSRLRTTGGRYHLADHHIDINPKILTYYGQAELIGVIIHELCHYHLHLTGQPYQHQSQAFRRLLAQTGGSRYAPPLPKTNHQQKVEVYQCRQCQRKYFRQRKLNLDRYACGRCGGKLTHIATYRQSKNKVS